MRVSTLPSGSSVAVAAPPAVRFELATEEDDRPLRQLLRETPMRGQVDVAFLREPDYFRAASMLGSSVQTLVARACGRIAGVATRALRLTRVNGKTVEAGYLGDLRLRPEFRARTVLARGYRFLRDLHADNRSELYSTVIMETNESALKVLAANRADLPRYTDQGRLLTPMIAVGGRSRRAPRRRAPGAASRPGETIERGTRATLPDIVRKLNENLLQFAPVWSEADFLEGRFPGLCLEDFYVLRRGGRIAGVLATWDQRSCRQTVVLGYRGLVGRLRPLVNLLRPAALPAVGTPLPFFYAAFIATDDVEAFRCLLRRVHDDAVGTAYTHFVVGLHERDPRAIVFGEFPHTKFAGRLFAVTFDAPPALDGRVPYLEAALL